VARLKDIAAGVKDLYMMDPAKITEELGWNARQEGPELDAHIRQLCDSIKEIGVQESVTVYMKGDTVVLTNGHCRLMAVRLAISEGAEIKSIPCRVEERYSNDADRVLSLITRNSGKPLSPLEQASVIKRLLGYEWKISEIAAKTGFSVSHVNDLSVLCGADVAVTQMVASGQVSATTAVKTVRKHGNKAPERLQEGVEVAQAAGSKRVTAKHLKQPVVPPADIPSAADWNVQGPRLLAHVLVMQSVADDQDKFADAYTDLTRFAAELEQL